MVVKRLTSGVRRDTLKSECLQDPAVVRSFPGGRVIGRRELILEDD